MLIYVNQSFIKCFSELALILSMADWDSSSGDVPSDKYPFSEAKRF